MYAQLKRTLQAVSNKLSQWFLHHQSFAGYIEPVIQHFKPAWRADLYRAHIECVEKTAEHFIRISLRPERNWPTHLAGQHINITVEMNGRLLTRTFTIASCPYERDKQGCISLLIRVDLNGRFTSQLSEQLKKIAWVNISKPQGTFVVQSLKKPLLMIAGGSGITPFAAMLAQHLRDIQEPVRLVYFAKADQHQLVEQLTQLETEHRNFSFELCTRAHSKALSYYISVSKLVDVYCCGPNEMLHEVQQVCGDLGLKYFDEVFGLKQAPTDHSLDTAAEHTLNVDGQVISVNSSDVLLKQLEEKNVAVTRGCGIGICHQCQCVKSKGVVRDIRTGALSDSGHQLIQLCISQPVSDLEVTL